MRVRRYVNKYGEEREELILTRAEQEIWFSNCLSRVLNNTRQVLDSLENSPEFQVNWENYHKKRCEKGKIQKDL